MEVLYSLFITLQVLFQLPGYILIIFPLNLISQALGVFIIYIKDFLKLPFIFYIAIIVSLCYLSLYITVLCSINICLAQDLFSSLNADLRYIKEFIYSDIVQEVYYNCPLVYCKYGVWAIPFIIPFFLGLFVFIFSKLTITILSLQNNALLSLQVLALSLQYYYKI